MAGPRQNVDPPSFTPLPYGLLSVVELPAPNNQHWQNGITYTSHCVSGMGSLTYDECITVTGTGGAPPAPVAKTGNVGTDIRGATPFTVYVEFDCAPVGNEQAVEVARNALAKAEPFQVEAAFWTGQIGGSTLVFPHLAGNTTVLDAQGILLQAPPVTGGPFDVVTGLGFLEDELASCYGGRGIIHVPSNVLPSLVAWNQIVVSGPTLKTVKGNLVAVGDGYPGTSPTGAAPTASTSWMYATGAVIAYRGQVNIGTLRDSLDRSNNTIRMIAERTYVLGYECCHVAAEVNLGVPES